MKPKSNKNMPEMQDFVDGDFNTTSDSISNVSSTQSDDEITSGIAAVDTSSSSNNNEETSSSSSPDKNLQETIVSQVKETLFKTLKVCLTATEAERIKQEFNKNIQVQQLLQDQMKPRVLNLSLPTVLEMIKQKDQHDAANANRKRMNYLEMKRKSPEPEEDEDDIDTLKKRLKPFVKPQFMRMESTGSQHSPYTSEKSRKLIELAKSKTRPSSSPAAASTLEVFEKTYTRPQPKNRDKVMKVLAKNKKKAEYFDDQKKYLGFGETFDPEQEKQRRREEKLKKKEQRKQEEIKRIRVLKKANVTLEEKNLMQELMSMAESESMNTDSSNHGDDVSQKMNHEETSSSFVSEALVSDNNVSVNDLNDYDDYDYTFTTSRDDISVDDFHSLMQM